MKKHLKCVHCEHLYRGASGNMSCLLNIDPADCQSFKPQQICCFDCKLYDVVEKRCLAGRTIESAFKRHTCSDYEREGVR